MNKMRNVPGEIEATLNSLDGVQRATANPFLYTRVEARIKAGNGSWDKAAGFIARPVFAFAALALFICINITVVYRSGAVAQQAAQQDAAQLFAAELQSPDYSIADLNTDK